ncbi:MAG: hypothetical protein Q7K40_00600 [bacterium]|nr:hypothetical protein [bacterium]
MIKKTKKDSKGAVLLIAILVSGVTLAVGFGVYNRTYKELLFASFWKQTQIAFSAADAGLECALYWDTNGGSPICFGSAISGWTPGTAGSFSAPVSSGCVSVIITKVGVSPSIVTTIESRGYNTCDATNLRRVERGLGVQY